MRINCLLILAGDLGSKPGPLVCPVCEDQLKTQLVSVIAKIPSSVDAVLGGGGGGGHLLTNTFFSLRLSYT